MSTEEPVVEPEDVPEEAEPEEGEEETEAV
jgi:hypothetical protein